MTCYGFLGFDSSWREEIVAPVWTMVSYKLTCWLSLLLDVFKCIWLDCGCDNAVIRKIVCWICYFNFFSTEWPWQQEEQQEWLAGTIHIPTLQCSLPMLVGIKCLYEHLLLNSLVPLHLSNQRWSFRLNVGIFFCTRPIIVVVSVLGILNFEHNTWSLVAYNIINIKTLAINVT